MGIVGKGGRNEDAAPPPQPGTDVHFWTGEEVPNCPLWPHCCSDGNQHGAGPQDTIAPPTVKL